MVFFCVRTDSHSLCHDGQTARRATLKVNFVKVTV
jgi:hypothetical protein